MASDTNPRDTGPNDTGPNDWTEVGEKFSSLGRSLRESWGNARGGAGDAGRQAEDEVRSAVQQVNESLDRLADAITHAVNDPEVHRAATSAAGGLVQAIGSSFDQLAQRIQGDGRRDDVAPGSDPHRGTDV